MSTRDPPLPPDVERAPQSLTTDGPHSTSIASTPGAALAGARVPGAPTLPDWDPATLSLTIQRMANALFQAPPAESALPAGFAPSITPPTALNAALPQGPTYTLSAPLAEPALAMTPMLESAPVSLAPVSPTAFPTA